MPRLKPQVPLSAELVDHACRRVIEVFAQAHPDCAVEEVRLCPCGCSGQVRTSCPEWDPALVFTEPAEIHAWRSPS